MPAYFLRYCYILVMFLVSATGFCSIGHRSISEILTSNLVARINSGYTKDEGGATGIVAAIKHGGAQGTRRGEQPDIETCVKESWAMHGVNPETGFSQDRDEVTQWYCDMFLPEKDPIGQLAVAAGIRLSIFSYDQSMRQDVVV